MRIVAGGLDHPAVRDLLALHGAEALASTPRENAHVLDADGLALPGMTMFTAWDGEELLGMAALRTIDAGHAEVKSMRTAPVALRRGVGRALLAHVVAEAGARRHARLSLETGTAAMFLPANAMYEAAGFVDCAAFGGYAPSPHNRFMTLILGE